MHLVIISCTPRRKEKSNTAKIIEAFKRGFEEKGNTTEVWYLYSKSQWEGARKAFEDNEHILFATPLFVENIPGLFLEFLNTLEPKKEKGTKVAFLIQGGFPEASQLRCAEKYLEVLPSYLNCEYGGTLLKGDMFGVSMLPEKMGKKMVSSFEKMGRAFADSGYFDKEEVSSFAAPEFLSGEEGEKFQKKGMRIQKIFMTLIAWKLGCRKPLDAKPYQE